LLRQQLLLKSLVSWNLDLFSFYLTTHFEKKLT
jgi:hypothetical protein